MTSPRDYMETSRPAGTRPSGRGRRALYLLLILILGAGLRFHGIRDLEPRIWDEGIYVLEGRFLSSFCSAVWDSGHTFLNEKLTGQDLWKKEAQFALIRNRIHGLPPRYGRILHDAFLAIGNLLAGETPYIGHLVNALLGTLTILWVFFLGRLMFNERIGLYAALIFAVMGYHIHYCRSGLAEADSLFFEIPAFYYYYKSRCRYPMLSQQDMALCGLFLGLGFTVHNRCMTLAGLIFLMELYLFWRPGNIKGHIKRARIVLFFVFFLFPSFLWEGIYHVVLLVFRRLEILMTTPTYLEQIVYGFWHSLLWGYISEAFRPAGFLTFPYLYVHMNGIVAFLLLLAGLCTALKRRSLADQILGVWFVVPLVFYSLTNAGLTRFFSLILAPGAIFSAAAFFSSPFMRGEVIARRRGKRDLLRPTVLLLLVVTAVYLSWTRILPARSGYAKTMGFLKETGDARVIATGEPLCQVYAGVDNVKRPPESMEELERLYKDGFRYYAIDYNRIIYTYYQMDRVKIMDQIAKDLEPVVSVSNDFILEPQYAFEGNLYFWKTLRMLKRIKDEEMDRIRLYDLREYFEPQGPGPGRSHPDSWPAFLGDGPKS